MRVTVRGLTVVHPGRSAPALAAVDVDVRPGEHVALLGRSGAGKSTLLRALLGAAPRTAGTVEVGGHDPYDPRARPAVLRATGWLPQGGDLVPSLSARANVVAGAAERLDLRGWWDLARGRVPAALAERVARLADEQGVAHLLGQRVGRLSGGQQQRVAVVRALLRGPALLLADEPTAGLDPGTAAAAVTALLGQDVTVVLATHDPVVAARFSRVVALADGRVVHDGDALAPEALAQLYASAGPA